jgi:hypothetical protein
MNQLLHLGALIFTNFTKMSAEFVTTTIDTVNARKRPSAAPTPFTDPSNPFTRRTLKYSSPLKKAKILPVDDEPMEVSVSIASTPMPSTPPPLLLPVLSGPMPALPMVSLPGSLPPTLTPSEVEAIRQQALARSLQLSSMTSLPTSLSPTRTSSEVVITKAEKDLSEKLKDHLFDLSINADKAFDRADQIARLTTDDIKFINRAKRSQARYLRAIKQYYDAIPVYLRKYNFHQQLHFMMMLFENHQNTDEFLGIRPPPYNAPFWYLPNEQDDWDHKPMDLTMDAFSMKALEDQLRELMIPEIQRDNQIQREHKARETPVFISAPNVSDASDSDPDSDSYIDPIDLSYI